MLQNASKRANIFIKKMPKVFIYFNKNKWKIIFITMAHIYCISFSHQKACDSYWTLLVGPVTETMQHGSEHCRFILGLAKNLLTWEKNDYFLIFCIHTERNIAKKIYIIIYLLFFSEISATTLLYVCLKYGYLHLQFSLKCSDSVCLTTGHLFRLVFIQHLFF